MFKQITATATWKQSQITVTGTIINGILGAFFYIFLARMIGPADFGLLTVSVAALTLIADIADLGTNTGIVRHVSANYNSDKNIALKFLKLGLEFKLFIWVLILTLGILTAPLLADSIFSKPELTMPLRLVMIGAGGALFLSFATSALQALQKYLVWSTVNILTNFFRLMLIFILVFSNNLNLFTGLFSYIVMPFFGFSLSLFFLPVRKLTEVKNEFSVAKQFFRYNIWVAFFTIIAAVSARLDTFLTARLLTNFEIGIYGAANQLVQVVPQLIGALGAVAAPKFAGFQRNDQMLIYLKKFQLLVSGLTVIGLLTLPITIYLIPILFGPAYLSTITPFIFLFLAMLIFLFSVPIHSCVIYYFGKPEVFAWISVGHLIITAVLGYFMISNFGVIGASLTVLVGTTFNFLAPLIWLLIKLKT